MLQQGQNRQCPYLQKQWFSHTETLVQPLRLFSYTTLWIQSRSDDKKLDMNRRMEKNVIWPEYSLQHTTQKREQECNTAIWSATSWSHCMTSSASTGFIFHLQSHGCEATVKSGLFYFCLHLYQFYVCQLVLLLTRLGIGGTKTTAMDVTLFVCVCLIVGLQVGTYTPQNATNYQTLMLGINKKMYWRYINIEKWTHTQTRWRTHLCTGIHRPP